MKPGKVVVIGGGVVGASSAYYLARDGWSVDLIDQGVFGAACSHGNCGYVCPSHVFPLCRPGAITKTLPLALRPNSPFAIRPRPDLRMLAWFARFAANCTTAKVHSTAAALNDLLWAAKRCYEEIIREEKIECDWQKDGCLFVYRDRHHLDAFAGENDEIQRRFGFSAKRLDGPSLAALEPVLREDLAGAWHFECDAHIRPDRFMAGLRAALERRGVTIHEHRAATAITGDGPGVLQTTRGPMRADAYVVAAGAWTPLLAGVIGTRLPIQPGKGDSLTGPRPAGCPRYPMVFEEHRVAITPWKSGFRIGSTMEFAGYDDSIREERLRLLTDSAKLYFREWAEPTFDERWYGWRPMTPDGKPFIDRSPSRRNVLVAAGHNMIGMSTGPGTGQLVADLLAGRAPAFEPAPFRIGR